MRSPFFPQGKHLLTKCTRLSTSQASIPKDCQGPLAAIPSGRSRPRVHCQRAFLMVTTSQLCRRTRSVINPFLPASIFRPSNQLKQIAIWTLIYQWSCYTTESLYNWTVVGAVCYILLFRASTWFTELVSAKKYPEYKEYQMRVGMFLPRMSTALKQ